VSGYVLAVISDTHFGGNTAVAPPQFEVHNRNTLETQTMLANRLQSWLYQKWQDFWAYVYGLQGKGRKAKRLIVVHLGDILDGNHHGTNQIIHEIGDQRQIALDMLEPIRNKANTFVGILGTMPSHAGQDHADEAAIYRELGADYIEQTLTLDLDGTLVDLAHHGRAGTRPWTTGAAALGAEVMLDYAQLGKPLPHYILRGHKHMVDDSGSKFERTRVIQCPSWQLKTSYSYRVAANTSRSDIGGVIIVDGVLDLSKSRYRGQPDARKVVKV
jgi:hypothetical protein